MASREYFEIVCIACKNFNGREIRLLTIGTDIKDTSNIWYCERKISKVTLKRLSEIRVYNTKLCECTNIGTYYSILNKYKDSKAYELDPLKAERRIVFYVNSLFRRGLSDTRLQTM